MTKEGEEDLYDAFLTEEQFQKESSQSLPKVSKPNLTSNVSTPYCLQVAGLPWWISDRDIKQRLGMALNPVDWLFHEHPITGKSLGVVILQWDQQEKLDAAINILKDWQPDEGCTLEVKPTGPLKEYRQRILKGLPWEEKKDAREPKPDVRSTHQGNVRDLRDIRDMRDGRDARDVRDVRDSRDVRDIRDSRDARDRYDRRDYEDRREYDRLSRTSHNSKDNEGRRNSREEEYRRNDEYRRDPRPEDSRRAEEYRRRAEDSLRAEEYRRPDLNTSYPNNRRRSRSPRARSPISAHPPVPRTGANQIPIGGSTEFQVNIGDRIVRRKR